MSGVEKVGDKYSSEIRRYFICLLSVETGKIVRKGKWYIAKIFQVNEQPF